MISIIVCSRHPEIPDEYAQNIRESIGCAFEFVWIDNSSKRYSITQAYNLGIERSKYPYLLFLHDDIMMQSEQWGLKLIAHLADPTTGIIGVAGTELVTRIPASWSAGFTHTHFTQSDRTGRKPTVLQQTPSMVDNVRQQVVMLDGVMMGMKKELAVKLSFDQRLSGFHGYDLDMTLASHLAGYRNYVVGDILLEHFSRGVPDRHYYLNLNHVYRKWGKQLPTMVEALQEKHNSELPKIEQKRLVTLRNRMIRQGFSMHVVKDNIGYWKHHTGQKVRCSTIDILLLRLFSSPKHLFKK